MNNKSALTIGILLFLGLSIGGYFIGSGFRNFKTQDRFITVKGFSEKEVKADIALWTLRLRGANNNLSEANLAIDSARNKVHAFLIHNGVKEDEIVQKDIQVTDRQTDNYAGQGQANALRFIITKTIEVKSADVDNLLRISRLTDELVQAGVAMSTNRDWQGTGLKLIFSKLSEVKPGMLAEANANARQAALEIAKGNNLSLGGLRKASQGVFSITDRDAALSSTPGGLSGSDLYKIVRVVVSNDYSIR
jgi:hypothetical protein